MSTRARYSSNRVEREARPDGTILLRSPHPLPEPVRTSADWLRRWAGERPDTVFLAERSGPGWRELRYDAALQQVRAVAAALLDRGLSGDTPILILSDPPPMADGEVTAKGNLNFAKVLTLRKSLVDRLYTSDDPGVIELD